LTLLSFLLLFQGGCSLFYSPSTASTQASQNAFDIVNRIRHVAVSDAHAEEMRSYKEGFVAFNRIPVQVATKRYELSLLGEDEDKQTAAREDMLVAMATYSRRVSLMKEKIAKVEELRKAWTKLAATFLTAQKELKGSMTEKSFDNLKTWIEANSKGYSKDLAALRKVRKGLKALGETGSTNEAE
tara:strand:+ start:2233 stop:2787 length:555 start_codon:yes stop_codon:yes gene_type:complete